MILPGMTMQMKQTVGNTMKIKQTLTVHHQQVYVLHNDVPGEGNEKTVALQYDKSRPGMYF